MSLESFGRQLKGCKIYDCTWVSVWLKSYFSLLFIDISHLGASERSDFNTLYIYVPGFMALYITCFWVHLFNYHHTKSTVVMQSRYRYKGLSQSILLIQREMSNVTSIYALQYIMHFSFTWYSLFTNHMGLWASSQAKCPIFLLSSLGEVKVSESDLKAVYDCMHVNYNLKTYTLFLKQVELFNKDVKYHDLTICAPHVI